jgi:hypothetical protein
MNRLLMWLTFVLIGVALAGMTVALYHIVVNH